jgi:hypothetical protein
MTGFDADWLRLREPLDAASRAGALAARLAAALRAGRSRPAGGPDGAGGTGDASAVGTGDASAAGAGTALRIVDLAAGTGANLRALAPTLGGDQDWTLVDLDPALLAAQAIELERWARREGWAVQAGEGGVTIRTGSATWRARARPLDLQASLETLAADPFDAVVTTAFLDLVSAEWLERLSRWLASARLPLLATLSVDGRRDWHPPLPADGRIDRAFRLHQAGDKGFGASLGIAAADHLAQRLSALGFEVSTERSDWRIGPDRRVLLERLAAEAAGAAGDAGDATRADPAGRAEFEAWAAARLAQAADGTLALEVGHLDLLALPPS